MHTFGVSLDLMSDKDKVLLGLGTVVCMGWTFLVYKTIKSSPRATEEDGPMLFMGTIMTMACGGCFLASVSRSVPSLAPSG